MKTIRFTKVVEKCGKPEIHLALTDPAKDRFFQTAVKTNRVMTVVQENVGTKTDRGLIGFEPGTHRQFLIFPKSLRAFRQRGVVGIKYDLLAAEATPKSGPAPSPKPTKKHSPKAPRASAASKTARASKASKAENATKPRPAIRKKSESVHAGKLVAFAPRPEEEEASEEVSELKRQVRQAMAVLEEGKPVAAFNLLKRIAES